VLSEEDDDEVVSRVVGSDEDVGSDVDVDVDELPEVVGSELDDDDWPFVLDIESIPVDAPIVSLVVDAVVSPSSPPQAHRARPTSADITAGADAWT